MKRALFRFGRVIAAAALAAGIQAAVQTVGDLPLDPVLLPLITAGLVALDKYLRDSGAY